MLARITMAVVFVMGSATAVQAQTRDSAAYIIRLGNDTVAIERFVRTMDRITVDAVQRSPSTVLHRLVMNLGPNQRVTGAEWTVTSPGAAQPSTHREFRLTADSAFVTTTQGGQARTQRIAVRDAVPHSGPFYTPYQLLIERALRGDARRVELPLLAGNAVVSIPLERAEGGVTLTNQFGEPMRAEVDARARLVRISTPAFTTVERVAWVDLDRLAADFAERDRTGRGMGALSTRQTFRSRVGEANLWVDYSRPAMRGRPIWGALVPFGQVWRLGANEATHLSTDRPLRLGDLDLDPGTYTLFLLPEDGRWTLIVNRATNIGGLDHDPAHDVGRIAMNVQTVQNPAELLTISIADGQLHVQWDRTRGSVPIVVR